MRVDLTSAVRFDLPRGAVHTTASGLDGIGEERAVLVPVSVLADALAAAPRDTREHMARALGGSIGRRAAARFGGFEGVRTAEVSSVIESLAAEIALAGFGILSIERWGKALVLALEAAPDFGSRFFAPLLEAALGATTAWQSRASLVCTHLADEDGARFLIANARSSDRVRAWISSGVSWAEALRRLQREGGGR